MRIITVACILVLLLSACDKNRVFEENKAIEGASWKTTDPVEFEVNIPDTSTFNAYLNIRNTSAYKFANIYVFMTTTFPDGKEAKDTLNCLLADERGKWLGKGAGDMLDNQILIKKNVFFSKPGKYKFKFEHGMRNDPLADITDVGFRIEKAAE